MITKNLFKKAFGSLVVTGGLNWIAVKLYLYWTVWWIDMVVHFFGGLTVGFATLWLVSKKKDLTGMSSKKILVLALIGAFAIGLLWEFYELYFQITQLSDGIAYWTDTISDLIMDSIGGIIAFLLSYLVIKKQNNF